MAGGKAPFYVDKIILSGATGSGIFGADGTSIVDEDFNVDSPITSSDLTLSGTLSVAGASTLTGAVGAAASITLGAGADLIGSSTSDITINTDKLTVAGATGNTVVGGTLTVNGATVDLGTTVECDAYTVGGTAGADFGPAAPASLTVVKGIVTAASS